MIQLKNINKFYQTYHEKIHALKDINLSFGNKGMNFIVGKSGSGKSTLLNIIGGIDGYDSGELLIDEVSTKNFSARDYNTYRNTYIGFVFQEFNVLKGLTVYENIALSLELQHLNVKENHQKIQAIIDKVGLTGLEKRRINQISGGEKQRVAIARALIKSPRVIIADEPTGNLDGKNSIIIMDLLKELSRDHLIIVVTHNRRQALEYADRLIEIKDGKIIVDQGISFTNQQQLSLQPINTPIKTSFNLALKSIWQNRIRFLFIILLFAISLTFASLVINLSLADTTSEYANYQKTYHNNYLSIEKKYLNHNIETNSAFYSFEYKEYYNLYQDVQTRMKVIKGMDFNLALNKNASSSDLYYTPIIQRIHLYTPEIHDGWISRGQYSNSDSIIITDYLAENLIYQNFFSEEGLTINQLMGKELRFDKFKNPLKIEGIIKTDYHAFDDLKNIDASVRQDQKTVVAFQDSLVFYNSIFMTEDNYKQLISTSNIITEYDDIIYSVKDKVGSYQNLKITTYDNIPFNALRKGEEPKKPEPGKSTQMALTTGFLREVLGLTGNLDTLYDYIVFEVFNGIYNVPANTPFYFNANRRIPTTISFIVTELIEQDEPILYMPLIKVNQTYDNYLRQSYTDGGFITMIINDNPNINSQLYRTMLKNNLIINNKAFLKVILVEQFISDNLWLFIGIFFVFALFSILLIFNFIIINIKNSKRDIGIYMSLGFSGFKIALIYFFQVIFLGVVSYLISIFGSIGFLWFLDIKFTDLSSVNLSIIKMTFTGIIAILGLATILPTSAIIIPLLNLSRKHPIDVIKTT